MDQADAPAGTRIRFLKRAATLSDSRERLLPSFSFCQSALWPDIVLLLGLPWNAAKPRPVGPASTKHIPRQ